MSAYSFQKEEKKIGKEANGDKEGNKKEKQMKAEDRKSRKGYSRLSRNGPKIRVCTSSPFGPICALFCHRRSFQTPNQKKSQYSTFFPHDLGAYPPAKLKEKVRRRKGRKKKIQRGQKEREQAREKDKKKEKKEGRREKTGRERKEQRKDRKKQRK